MMEGANFDFLSSLKYDLIFLSGQVQTSSRAVLAEKCAVLGSICAFGGAGGRQMS